VTGVITSNPDRAGRAATRTVRAPALAVVTLDRSGGGVAVVADLLWDVLRLQFGDMAQLVTLLPDAHQRPTFADKLRFGARVARAQLGGGADWMLFSHLALAKANDYLPAGLRRGYGIFLHGIEAWCPLSAREKRLLRDADLRIANSEYTARRVMREHDDIGEVVACPLALRPHAIRPAAGTVLDPGPRAVLVVGRMLSTERYKGHDQLLESWPAVVAAVPDARLVVVGDGDDRSRLERKAAALGLASSVIFTGFVPDEVLHALFERAAVFALPSRGEGFGLVYLEAMARHLPCVGSIHDAGAEVIVDHVTGRLVDQADLANMSATLVALLRDPALRRQMGDAGFRRLSTHFGFERFSRQIAQLLAIGDVGSEDPTLRTGAAEPPTLRTPAVGAT